MRGGGFRVARFILSCRPGYYQESPTFWTNVRFCWKSSGRLPQQAVSTCSHFMHDTRTDALRRTSSGFLAAMRHTGQLISNAMSAQARFLLSNFGRDAGEGLPPTLALPLIMEKARMMAIQTTAHQSLHSKTQRTAAARPQLQPRSTRMQAQVAHHVVSGCAHGGHDRSSGVDMWSNDSLDQAFGDGHRCLTPVLLLFIVLGLACLIRHCCWSQDLLWAWYLGVCGLNLRPLGRQIFRVRGSRAVCLLFSSRQPEPYCLWNAGQSPCAA